MRQLYACDIQKDHGLLHCPDMNDAGVDVPEENETDADIIGRIANTPQTRACIPVSLVERS